MGMTRTLCLLGEDDDGAGSLIPMQAGFLLVPLHGSSQVFPVSCNTSGTM